MSSSLFTNPSSQTALRTLSMASQNLAGTQNRISTGYRINTAEDNAAYWSIATTLRSDVNALKAVQDALGLGAATVDTVYTGINDTKDLLDQIKSKLVTASQAGVPRKQVQAEVTQLQNRLKDVSTSTVINGESWLTQDSSSAGYNSTKTVVGSFTRSGGAITVDTINIDISETKLYEKSTAAQEAVTTALDDSSTGALKDYVDALEAIEGIVSATDVEWNTEVGNIATDAANGIAVFGQAGITAALTAASTEANRDAWAAAALTDAQLTTALTDFNAAFGGDGAAFVDALAVADRTALLAEVNGYRTTLQAAVRAVEVTGGGSSTVTAAGVTAQNEAFATYTSNVQGALQKVFGLSQRDAFVAKTGEDARKAYEATAKADTDNAQLGIFDKVRTVVSAADGSGAKAVRVSDIDISNLTDTDFDRSILSSYISVVDSALQELTLSATVVGAAKARIEGNKVFVKNLVDANNRGIGQLVDADLNEESAKLKALQTQEQLAIQALAIANSSSQNILRLFQ